MNCAKAKRNIEALLDGELHGPLRNSVENHVRICPACCETRDEGILLSRLLQTNEIREPSAELDKHLINAFRERYQPKATSSWRKIIFASVTIPKPILAALLIFTMAGPWLAFQIGKINAATISILGPIVASPASQVQIPVEGEKGTVIVEIPTKERKAARRHYIPGSRKERKSKMDAAHKSNILQSYSSVANNGYFTDLNLQGFQPLAEIGVQIIKEVKQNEK